MSTVFRPLRAMAFVAFSWLVLPACGEVVSEENPDAAPMSFEWLRDNSFEDFAAGTFQDTQYVGDRVQLSAGQSVGEFVSRVFDAQRERVELRALGWLARAPYGRPLPGDGERESGYQSGGANMDNNVLLLRFDETDEIGDGQMLADASGRNNHARAASAVDVLRPEPGLFDGALADSISTHAYIDLAETRSLDFGTGDFTWALWSRAVQDCTGNKVYMGGDGQGQDRVHLWLGCADSEANSVCASRPGDAGGRAAGTFRANHGLMGDGAGLCGTSRINDGQWHHLAIVKSGHNPTSNLTLYVDGRIEMSVDVTFAKELTFANQPHFTIGDFTSGNGQYQSAATFDELGIWRRALSSDEIAGLHRRGALRLRLQVRMCADAECVTATGFVGPGQDPSRYFIDRNGPDIGGSIAHIIARPMDFSSQFFQYRALFDSDIVDESPRLNSVTLVAEE